MKQWVNLAKCSLILTAATAASYLFFMFTDNPANASIWYMLAVFLVSKYTSGYFWGILAAAAGVVGVNYIFTYPYYVLDFMQFGYPITFLGMLIVSVITSTMTSHINRQKDAAIERENVLTQLNQFNQQLLKCKSKEDMLNLSVRFLSELNHASVLFRPVEMLPETTFPVQLWADDTAQIWKQEYVSSQADQTAAVKKEYFGETEQFDYHFFPVNSSEQTFGVMILCFHKKAANTITNDLNRLILAQVVLSLEYYELTEHHHNLVLETEKEKMRSNLLRAVSHDLRTPLTSMIGSSSTYLETKDFLEDSYKDRLISGIYEDANWLLNMVENLLSVTRIQQETAKVTKKPESLEEVVSEAVVRFQKRFPDSSINVRIPAEFLMLPMDATLIEQVIINLLENAIRHAKSTKPIDLHVKQKGDHVLFSIKDYGLGIAADRLDSIFDGCAASGSEQNDSQKGMGIGLSICKTIIIAHNGTIAARNHDGGAEFYFSLPMEGDI